MKEQKSSHELLKTLVVGSDKQLAKTLEIGPDEQLAWAFEVGPYEQPAKAVEVGSYEQLAKAVEVGSYEQLKWLVMALNQHLVGEKCLLDLMGELMASSLRRSRLMKTVSRLRVCFIKFKSLF